MATDFLFIWRLVRPWFPWPDGQERLRVSKAAGNRASRRVSEREGARLLGVEALDYVSGRGAGRNLGLPWEEWNSRRGLR